MTSNLLACYYSTVCYTKFKWNDIGRSRNQNAPRLFYGARPFNFWDCCGVEGVASQALSGLIRGGILDFMPLNATQFNLVSVIVTCAIVQWNFGSSYILAEPLNSFAHAKQSWHSQPRLKVCDQVLRRWDKYNISKECFNNYKQTLADNWFCE